MKKNVFVLILILFVVLGTASYFLTSFIAKNKANDLTNFTISKSKAVINSYLVQITKSVKTLDDVGLVISIDNLSKNENISSAFILNKNSKIIVHNDTNEWDKERNSQLYQNAITKKRELLQNTDDENYVLYSVPIDDNNTLFCLISLQESLDLARNWKIKYFTIAVVCLLVIVFIIYFCAKIFILQPFERIKKSLEKDLTQTIQEGKYSEITDIFATENAKYNTIIKSIQEDNLSLGEIVKYLSGSSQKQYNCFIILNSKNNIVYATDKTNEILKKDFKPQSHILEALQSAKIIDILSTALEQPSIEQTQTFDKYEVSVLVIGNKKSVTGTIIKVS